MTRLNLSTTQKQLGCGADTVKAMVEVGLLTDLTTKKAGEKRHHPRYDSRDVRAMKPVYKPKVPLENQLPALKACLDEDRKSRLLTTARKPKGKAKPNGLAGEPAPVPDTGAEPVEPVRPRVTLGTATPAQGILTRLIRLEEKLDFIISVWLEATE